MAIALANGTLNVTRDAGLIYVSEFPFANAQILRFKGFDNISTGDDRCGLASG